MIFKFTLRIMANFALFKDVSGMYLEVDRRCIQEGLLLVDKLNISNIDADVKDDQYFKQNRLKLSEFCNRAEETVRDVVQTKQKEIMDGLQKRITDIGESIEKFPPEYQPTNPAMAIEYQSIKQGAELAQTLTETEAAAAHEASPVYVMMTEVVRVGDDDEEM